MRSETFPDRVKGRGHMAPDPAFFHWLLFLSSVGVTKRVGTGNQRVILRGFCCCFVCVLCFFLIFAVNFVKLHICFLLALPHNVNSFHSVESLSLWLTHVKRGCQGVSLSSLVLICVCFLEPLGRAGWWDVGGLGRSKRRERVSAAKFCLTQQKQNNCTDRTAQQHAALCPPVTSNPPKPTTHPHPPLHRLSSSLTHWTCPRSCMHLRRLASNSPSATATPAAQPRDAETVHLGSLALRTSFLLHLHLRRHYPHYDMRVWQRMLAFESYMNIWFSEQFCPFFNFQWSSVLLNASQFHECFFFSTLWKWRTLRGYLQSIVLISCMYCMGFLYKKKMRLFRLWPQSSALTMAKYR